MGAEDLLKELGFKVRESDNPERSPIDFTIEDGKDNVAWVWGSGEIVAVDNERYDYDYEVECDHAIVDYGDDDEQGYCPICGKHCDWHYEESADDGYTIKERVPHCWHEGDGGIIKQYVKENYA